MVGKYKVITLCGSTRFKDAFMEAQKRLTLEGNIVIWLFFEWEPSVPFMVLWGRKSGTSNVV